MHSGVPVGIGVAVERPEDDGQDRLAVLGDEADDVVVVPEEEGALRHLEVRRVDALGDDLEEGVHHLGELGRLLQRGGERAQGDGEVGMEWYGRREKGQESEGGVGGAPA